MTRTPHSSPVARAIVAVIFATGLVVPLACATAIEGFGDGDSGGGDEDGGGRGGQGGGQQFTGAGPSGSTSNGSTSGSGAGAGSGSSSGSTSASSSAQSSVSSAVSSSVASSSVASSSSGGGGACCVASFSPGCSDLAIANCVCSFDDYCCTDEWDDICVDEVTQLGCGFCP